MTLTFRFLTLTAIVMLTGAFFDYRAAKTSLADEDPAPNTAALTAALYSSTHQASKSSGSDLDISAAAYGVYTAYGVQLSASNEAKRWPIASLTKLMTALVAREKMQLNQKVIVQNIDTEIQGFAGGFSVGEIFYLRDLEEALLVVSSNAAADAIADFYGRDRFVDTMNNYAYKLGLSNTFFVDPSGLSYKNQSTVEDLDKLVRYILNNKPEIFAVTRMKTAQIQDLKTGRRRNLQNINTYAGKMGFIGGKTGTTPEAVGNLITIMKGTAKTPDKIIILLGTESRYEETDNILTKWNPK